MNRTNTSRPSVDWTDQTEFTENLLSGPFNVNMDGWLNEDEYNDQGRSNANDDQSLETFNMENLYGGVSEPEVDGMVSSPSSSSTKSSSDQLLQQLSQLDQDQEQEDNKNNNNTRAVQNQNQQQEQFELMAPMDSDKSNQTLPRKKQHKESISSTVANPGQHQQQHQQQQPRGIPTMIPGNRSNISKAFITMQSGQTQQQTSTSEYNASVYNMMMNNGGQQSSQCASNGGNNNNNLRAGETEADNNTEMASTPGSTESDRLILNALVAEISNPIDFAVTDSGANNSNNNSSSFANSNNIMTSGSNSRNSLKSCSFDDNDSVDGDFSSEGDSEFGGSGDMDFDGGGDGSDGDDDGDNKAAGGGDDCKKRRNKSEVNVKAKNREHAKNTRMRKKNFIEALKDSVKLLSDERDKVDRDRRISLSRLAEQTNVRKQVLQTMFFFRATAETSVSRWSTILDDSFQLVMPITPYRSFPPFEIVNAQRRAAGIDAMIADTASLAVMVQSIGVTQDDGDQVRVQYYSGPEDTIMTGDSFMCKWLLRTENAVRRGARYEVFKQGMLKSTFSPQNKLTYLELSFDVMSFMQQLRRASGKNDFMVVPNTLPIAKEESPEARVIIEANHPYRISYVSQSWCELFGYQPLKLVGEPLRILHGIDAEVDKINALVASVRLGRPSSALITSYTQDGDKFKNFVRLYPLYTTAEITHYLAVMEIVQEVGVAVAAPYATARVAAAVSVSSGSTNTSGSSMRSGSSNSVSSSAYRNNGGGNHGSHSPSTVSSVSSNVSAGSSTNSGATDSSGVPARGPPTQAPNNGAGNGGVPPVTNSTSTGQYTGGSGGRNPSVSSISSLGNGLTQVQGLGQQMSVQGNGVNNSAMMNSQFGPMSAAIAARQGIPNNMTLPQYQSIMAGVGMVEGGGQFGGPQGYMLTPGNGMLPPPYGNNGTHMGGQYGQTVSYMTAGPGTGLNTGGVPIPGQQQLPPVPAIHADALQYIPRAPLPLSYEQTINNLGGPNMNMGISGLKQIGSMGPGPHMALGPMGLAELVAIKEERANSSRIPDWRRNMGIGIGTGMNPPTSSSMAMSATAAAAAAAKADKKSSSSSHVGSSSSKAGRTPKVPGLGSGPDHRRATGTNVPPSSVAIASAPTWGGGDKQEKQSPKMRSGGKGRARSPRPDSSSPSGGSNPGPQRKTSSSSLSLSSCTGCNSTSNQSR